MVRPEKLATPATAACVGDPDSVPPPALFPMASVTFAANPVAVLPKLSRAVTWMAGIAATATRKSVADSTLFPNGTHALARAVWSTTRDRQWYAVLSLNPATAAVATVPFATVGPVPVTAPLNGVPTGLTSTSRCSWSPGFGSVTLALKITDRPDAVPPTGMAVTPSLWNCAVSVGGAGGCGMVVTKSPSVSGFPPNAVQALARSV